MSARYWLTFDVGNLRIKAEVSRERYRQQLVEYRPEEWGADFDPPLDHHWWMHSRIVDGVRAYPLGQVRWLVQPTYGGRGGFIEFAWGES